MLTLLSSSTSTILLRALYKNQKFDVCVCVCTMPSSLTLSTSYSVVRPMLNNLRELLPPVPHNTPDLQAIRQRHCYQVFHLAWATS